VSSDPAFHPSTAILMTIRIRNVAIQSPEFSEEPKKNPAG
jgi:hypothetical protein